MPLQTLRWQGSTYILVGATSCLPTCNKLYSASRFKSQECKRKFVHSEHTAAARKCRLKPIQCLLGSQLHGCALSALNAPENAARCTLQCGGGSRQFSDRGTGTCVGAELRGAECKPRMRAPALYPTHFVGPPSIVDTAPARARAAQSNHSILRLFPICQEFSAPLHGFSAVMILTYAPLNPLGAPPPLCLPCCHLLGSGQVSKTGLSCLS